MSVRQIDVEGVATRIREELPSLSKVDQKDLCLFIGRSGSAKTTLICFLRKKKLIERKEEEKDANNNVIECNSWVDTEQPDPGFIIGNQVAGGVTKSINTDTIPGSYLLIGDTCGFLDPAGTVDIGVDIANAVTIQNAMKRARSVRPVLVFSIGILAVSAGRASGFIDLLLLMANFFSPIQNYLKNLTFFFTGGDPRHALKQILKSELVKNDVLGPGMLEKFVGYIYQYVCDNYNSCVVLPKDIIVADAGAAELNRTRFLDLIERTIPITDVRSVGCPLTLADRTSMQSKCLALKDEIVSSLTENCLDRIAAPLGLLETLRDNVGLEEIGYYFQNSFDIVQGYIQQLVQSATKALTERKFNDFLAHYKILEAASALQTFVDVKNINERLLQTLNALVREFKLIIFEGISIDEGETLIVMNFLREINQNLSALVHSSCRSAYADMRKIIESRIVKFNASCSDFLKLFLKAVSSSSTERDLLERFPLPFTHANRNAQSFIDFFSDFASLRAASKFTDHLQPDHLSCYKANSALLYDALKASYDLTMDESHGLVAKITAASLTIDESAKLCRIHFLLSLCYYPRDDDDCIANKHIQANWGLLDLDKDLLASIIEKLRALILILDQCVARSDFIGMVKPLNVLVNTKLDDEEYVKFQAQEVVPKINLLRECVETYYLQTKKDFESLQDRQSLLTSDVEAFVGRVCIFAPCVHLERDLFPSEGGTLIKSWVSTLIAEIEAFFGGRSLSFRSIIQGEEEALSDEIVRGKFLNIDHMVAFNALIPEMIARESKAVVADINVSLSKLEAISYSTDLRGFVIARLLAQVSQLEFILPSLRESEFLRLIFPSRSSLESLPPPPPHKEFRNASSHSELNFLEWVKLLTERLESLHTAVIKFVVNRMEASTTEVKSALEQKDSGTIGRNLDMLKSFGILDLYLQLGSAQTASEIYSKVRSELSEQISSLKAKAESAAARMEINTSEAIEEFFRQSSKYAHHFDIQFDSVADALKSINSKVADTLPGMIADHLRENDYDSVKKKMVGIVGASITGSPLDNDVFSECDRLLSSHLNELVKRVWSATEDETDDVLNVLKEILPIASRAMVLSGVVGITNDPADLLNLIYETCDTLYKKHLAHFINFLTARFKFSTSELEFKTLCRFRMFDSDLKPHLRKLKGNVLSFGDRIAAMKVERIDCLDDALDKKLLEFLGFESTLATYTESMDEMSDMSISDGILRTDELMLENLLRGVSSVVEADKHSMMFKESVDFFDIKGKLSSSISKHLKSLVDNIKDRIRKGGKELDTAVILLENANKILGIASQYKFVTNGYSDMRRNFEKQERALQARRGEGRILNSFTFDAVGVKNAHSFLQNAEAEDYETYITFKDVIKAKFLETKNQTLKTIANLRNSRSSAAYEQIKKFMITMILYFSLIVKPKEDEDLYEHWNEFVSSFMYEFISLEFANCDKSIKHSMHGARTKEDLCSLQEVVKQVRDKLPHPDHTKDFEKGLGNITDELYRFLTHALEEMQKLSDEVDLLIVTVNSMAHALESIDIFKTPDMKNEIHKLQTLASNEPVGDSSSDRPVRRLNSHGFSLRLSSDSGGSVGSKDAKSYSTVLREITDQLNGAAERVNACLSQEDFSTIAIGISNISELKSYEPLQSLSENALKSIHGSLAIHAANLKGEFSEQFKHKNFVILEAIISTATTRDREFEQLIHVKFVPPLLDVMIAAFQHEIAGLAVYHAQHSVNAKHHAKALVELKKFVSGISNSAIQNLANDQINKYVDILTVQENIDFFELAAQLSTLGPLGRLIISTSPRFAEVARENMINAITQAGITLDHALLELRRLNPDMNDSQIDILRELGKAFDGYFKDHLRSYVLGYEGNFNVRPKADLVREVNRKVTSVKKNVTCTDLIEILAGVFAYWSLLSTLGSSSSNTDRKNSKKQVVVMEPHIVQLLAIFRLLELDKPKSWADALNSLGRTLGSSVAGMSFDLKMAGHLIQVGTGEGKSILLGGLSCLLALLGFNVYCACYSKHLSKRDYLAFRELFHDFSVLNRVHYSTLADLAETVINKDGDLRSMVEKCVLLAHSSSQTMNHKIKSDDRQLDPGHINLLLIDEVDVFFSQEFYGSTYNPIQEFVSPEAAVILTKIWQDRNTNVSFPGVQRMPEVAALKAQFRPEVSGLIDQQIHFMLQDVKAYDNPKGQVMDVKDENNKVIAQRIHYRVQDSYSYMVKYRYKTAFLYLEKAQRHPMLTAELPMALALLMPCGMFSYAEIPKKKHFFQCVMGVTGTLQCLSPGERDIITKDYKIQKETYIPSLYGTTLSTTGQRTDKFSTDDVIAVAPDLNKFHQMIQNEIAKNQQANKPVLVFFATEGDLQQFLDSSYGQKVNNCSVVTEKTENIDYHVQYATIILDGKVPVTLFPRIFGRGTNFVVYDDAIDTVGGVHVVQTFFSQFLAEEIQIQGRTARQGKSGSYKMIVLSSEIEIAYGLTSAEVEQESRKKTTFYDFMFQKRAAAMTAVIDGMKETAAQARAQHNNSISLQNLLMQNGSRDRVVQIIKSFASTSSGGGSGLHIIICLDESGSMISYWTSLVDAVMQFLNIRMDSGAGNADLITVIKFGESATLLWDKVSQHFALANRDAMVRKGYGTNFIPALRMVNQQMLSETTGMGVAVVFMTDGEASDGKRAAAEVAKLQVGFSGSSFQFFGVFFRAGEEQANGESILQKMVQAVNGGKMVLATNVEELRNQFQSIAHEVSASFRH